MRERITFERDAYTINAVQKAAYRVSRFLTIDIELNERNIICTLDKTLETSDEEYSHALEEFKKHALDYVLREKISEETEAVRNVILSLAFSKSGLGDE